MSFDTPPPAYSPYPSGAIHAASAPSQPQPHQPPTSSSSSTRQETRHRSAASQQQRSAAATSSSTTRPSLKSLGSSSSSLQYGIPSDYNPLQYPPPSRIKRHNSGGLAAADVHQEADDSDAEDSFSFFPTWPGSISGVTITKKHDHHVSGATATITPKDTSGNKEPKTYRLRSPIQPKEFIKGARLAIEGSFIALTNPQFRQGRLYKTLARLLLFTLIIHLVTQILFFLPIWGIRTTLRLLSFATETDSSESMRGLELFANKVQEIVSSAPLLGLLFLRYLYPQPLDDIFMDALVYSDTLLVQQHAVLNHQQSQQAARVSQQSPSSNNNRNMPTDPVLEQTNVMDHRGLFAPALSAYPYKVRRWQEMWSYARRTWKRLKWGLLILVMSWIPFLGRFAFPLASFVSTLQSIGSKPLAVMFAMTSFVLPRWVSVFLLKGFFSCRALTRELLDPYFIRLGLNHYQKRKWFNYRKSVLLGFGVACSVACNLPYIGVLMYGLAAAAMPFALQTLADPPPPPVVVPKSSSKKK